MKTNKTEQESTQKLWNNNFNAYFTKENAEYLVIIIQSSFNKELMW